MKFSKLLLRINCWLFVAFGTGFTMRPELLSKFIADTSPSTTSAIIDLRATYGGMALGLAFIFYQFTKKEILVPYGIQGVFAVMTALATTRLLGIIIDGSPNIYIILLFISEVLMAGLTLFAMSKTPIK